MHGTDIIEIEGVKSLKDVSYNIMPDRIETGTFLCIAAITGGNIIAKGLNPDHITPVLYKLEEAGCRFDIRKNEIELQAPKRLKAVDIKTMPYPGFPTDMQPMISTILTIAKGTSIVVENIFEIKALITNASKLAAIVITNTAKRLFKYLFSIMYSMLFPIYI